MRRVSVNQIRNIPLGGVRTFYIPDGKALYSARSTCSYWNTTEGVEIGYRVSLSISQKDKTKATIRKYKIS